MSTKSNHRKLQWFMPVFECLEDRLAPATITVTTRADIVKPGDGKISLREAITRANATKAPDTIVLAPGVYRIALAGTGEDANVSGDFDVTRPLTIKGQGSGKTFVDGAHLDRLFDIHGAFKVSFTDLTLRNGATAVNGGGATADNGGAIQATVGNLQLTHCVVRDNTAAGSGGGIFMLDGNLALTGSTVTGNVTEGFGGGIQAGGATVKLSNSTVSGNAALSGGGILADTATLINSTVIGNSAKSQGGGILTNTSVTLIKSTVSANSAKESGAGIVAGGGGIFAGTTATLIKSSVLGNFAELKGGGIVAFGGATLIKSKVIGNRSGKDGGGIFISNGAATLTNSTVSNNVADRSGGGIEADSATLTNSTVSGNLALSGSGSGGGINTTTATLTNSAVSGNSAGKAGGGINAFSATLTNTTVSGNGAARVGGGISANTVTATNSTINGNSAGTIAGGIDAGNVTLINSTVSGNSAVEGGGIFANEANLLHATITQNSAHTGGGVFQQSSGPFTLKNTIIAQNHVDAGGARPDVFGNFTSLGHNLIGIKDGGVGFSSPTDLLGTTASPFDPKLGPLKNNGGATKTHALLPGSPAIDAGANDPLATLTAPVTATAARLFVSDAAPFAPGMALRLDREVVVVLTVDVINKTLTVQRAGPKKRAAHGAGAALFLANDQRGIDRPRDGDGNGSRLVDIGAFEV